MPSFLQIVLGACICYLIVRGLFTPTPRVISFNLPDTFAKSSSADTDDDELDAGDDFESVFTKQAGLHALEMLIDKRPEAKTCEDIVDFLKAFEANKDKWGVTKEDLRTIYLRRYSLFFLAKMFAKTVVCCPDYAKYLETR